jgi:hypothetical protein
LGNPENIADKLLVRWEPVTILQRQPWSSGT